jgi:hypothetical protein
LSFHELNTPDEKATIQTMAASKIHGCNAMGILKVLGVIPTIRIIPVAMYPKALTTHRLFI